MKGTTGVPKTLYCQKIGLQKRICHGVSELRVIVPYGTVLCECLTGNYRMQMHFVRVVRNR